ncbi:MAG: hypothetical protein ACPG5L_05330 [Vibrio gallaecicus]
MKTIIAISCAAVLLSGCQTAPTEFKPISVQAVQANSSQALKIATDAVALLKTKVSLDTPLEFKPVGGLGQVLAFKLQEAGYSVNTRAVNGSIPVSYTLDSLDSMKLFMFRAGNYQVNRVYKSSASGLALVSSSARTARNISKNIFLSNPKVKPVVPDLVSFGKPKKSKAMKARLKRSLIIDSMTSEIAALEKELVGLQTPKKIIKRVTAKPRQVMTRKPVRVARAQVKRPVIKLVSHKTSVMPKKEAVNVQELISPFDVTTLLSKKQFAYIERQSKKIVLPTKRRNSEKYFLQLFASKDKQLLLQNQKLVSGKGFQSEIVKKPSIGVLRIYSNDYKELVNAKRVLLRHYDDSYIKKVSA